MTGIARGYFADALGLSGREAMMASSLTVLNQDHSLAEYPRGGDM
jgi:hypothetical protein